MRRRDFIKLTGGAALWPIAVHAQQNPPVIGFLSTRSPDDSKYLIAAFRQGLSAAGFSEGQNVQVEYRWALGQYDRLPAQAVELVRRPVTLLVTLGGEPATLAAKAATSTIPIVFGVAGDPVKLGLADSFNRPGRNATGMSILTTSLGPKRLGLLHELAPQAATVGFLVNASFPLAQNQRDDAEKAARELGLNMVVLPASSDDEIERAFKSLDAEGVKALLVAAAPFFDTRKKRILDLVAQRRLPTMYQFREYPVAGGLVSYGIDLPDVYRQVGTYAGRVLKGERPADLPILQPTKFELVINTATAKALGIVVPPGIMSIADEVIE